MDKRKVPRFYGPHCT